MTRFTKREQELNAAQTAKEELEQLKRRHAKLKSEHKKMQVATKAGFLSSNRYGLPAPAEISGPGPKVRRSNATPASGSVDPRAGSPRRPGSPRGSPRSPRSPSGSPRSPRRIGAKTTLRYM